MFRGYLIQRDQGPRPIARAPARVKLFISFFDLSKVYKLLFFKLFFKLFELYRA